MVPYERSDPYLANFSKLTGPTMPYKNPVLDPCNLNTTTVKGPKPRLPQDPVVAEFPNPNIAVIPAVDVDH
jgi:hypothetical protein